MFQHKGLSASLASRLSRGGERGFQRSASTKFKSNRPSQINNLQTPSNGLHGRLGLPLQKKKSVYSRLTISNNKQRILKVQSKAFLKSIEAIEDSVHRPNVHRPIKSLKTKSSRDDFQPVRINNGAVVKGLRSDQLILQKYREQSRISLESNRLPLKMTKEMDTLSTKKYVPLMRSSKVSVDFNSGLTVSFNNDSVKRNRARTKAVRKKLEQISPISEDSYPLKGHQQPFFRTESTEEAKIPLLRIGMERPPPPKPHKQVLDLKVQKEIAALQGHLDTPHSGPGPGVKNFRMIPSLTKHSLSERFTIDRTIVE